MKHLGIVLLLATMSIVVACQQPAAVSSPTVDLNQARAEVSALNDRWVELYNARDFDALVMLYSEDAVVLGPERALRGHDEILSGWDEDDGDGTATANHIYVSPSGELAYMHGVWTSGNGAAGSFISVLGKRDGNWVFLSDSYNVETSPSAE
jgi:ketosteroid isomerase-like protein